MVNSLPVPPSTLLMPAGEMLPFGPGDTISSGAVMVYVGFSTNVAEMVCAAVTFVKV